VVVKLVNVPLAGGDRAARHKKNAKFILRWNGDEGAQAESGGATARGAWAQGHGTPHKQVKKGREVQGAGLTGVEVERRAAAAFENR
jgi:hypothetical protein